MPVYEYELNDDEPECQICPGRFAVLQAVSEDAVAFCPTCGLGCHRVVSKAHLITARNFSAGDAARKGLTTYKRVRKGEWEKVDGPGVDAIVGREEDVSAIEAESVKKVQLDES